MSSDDYPWWRESAPGAVDRRFVNHWGEEPGMTVRCVDCGMTMSAHEMVAHDCPAPGEARLLGVLEKEQKDAASEPTTPAPPEQHAPAEGEPAGPDPDLQC